jgi:isoleucyl-tRNA synthetase
VYQSLLATSPPPKDPSADVRSVHFVSFPEMRKEYFDPVIERQVQRLKAVIDLGRVIRDRKTLKVKVSARPDYETLERTGQRDDVLTLFQMPLKELVIFHHDQEYLDDVKSLESYIAAELNIVNIVYTSDESAVGIKYMATADFATLGRKLRKDLGKVRGALPSLTSDQCKAFVTEGKMNVSGVELVTGDLIVSRFVELGDSKTHESATDMDVIVLLDIRRHPELERMALLRALTARVNKLRKEAGLKPSDKVDVLYKYDDGEQDLIREAVGGNEEYLTRAVGAIPIEVRPQPGREGLAGRGGVHLH